MAFLLPAIVRMQTMKTESKLSGRKPAVVVMAPTRELAQQINEVATKVLPLPPSLSTFFLY
jgi:superfamily II DNA/RNA helicase